MVAGLLLDSTLQKFVKFWSVDFEMCESDDSGRNCKTSSNWSSRILRRPPSIVWEGIGGSAPGGCGGDIWLKTGPNTTTSISVTNTSIPVTSGARISGGKNERDSALNSLECWDYSVELECLRGPDGMFEPTIHISIWHWYLGHFEIIYSCLHQSKFLLHGV